MKKKNPTAAVFCVILRVKQHGGTYILLSPSAKLVSSPGSHPSYFHRKSRQMKGRYGILYVIHPIPASKNLSE